MSDLHSTVSSTIVSPSSVLSSVPLYSTQIYTTQQVLESPVSFDVPSTAGVATVTKNIFYTPFVEPEFDPLDREIEMAWQEKEYDSNISQFWVG